MRKNRRVAADEGRAEIFQMLQYGRGVAGVARLALFYCVLVILQTFLFVYVKETRYMLVLHAMVPGLLLGVALRVFEWCVALLKGVTTHFMGRLLAGFMLFFVYLIGYIYLFSLVVANPLGRVILEKIGSAELARDYGLYSVNSIIILAILSWLQWLRGIAWNPPRRTPSRHEGGARDRRK